MSFLAELQAGYKNANVLLSTKQLRALDVSPTTPFDKETVNEDFASLAAQYFTFKVNIMDCINGLRRKLLQPNATCEIPDVEEHGKMLATLNKAVERIRKIWELKLKVTEEMLGSEGLPRIIRLARRLELSEKETILIVYIFTSQMHVLYTIGKESFSARSSAVWNSTSELCRVCEFSISEISDFFRNDRVHMQQGLFPEVKHAHILNTAVRFDDVPLRALMGLPLTSSEFLRIEQTHLADVIVEESGNEHYRQGVQQPKGMDDTASPSVQVLL